jgi:hypothetical protein
LLDALCPDGIGVMDITPFRAEKLYQGSLSLPSEPHRGAQYQ